MTDNDPDDADADADADDIDGESDAEYPWNGTEGLTRFSAATCLQIETLLSQIDDEVAQADAAENHKWMQSEDDLLILLRQPPPFRLTYTQISNVST